MFVYICIYTYVVRMCGYFYVYVLDLWCFCLVFCFVLFWMEKIVFVFCDVLYDSVYTRNVPFPKNTIKFGVLFIYIYNYFFWGFIRFFIQIFLLIFVFVFLWASRTQLFSYFLDLFSSVVESIMDLTILLLI